MTAPTTAVDRATPVEMASPWAALTRPCSDTGASESSWVDRVGDTMPMPSAATAHADHAGHQADDVEREQHRPERPDRDEPCADARPASAR